MPPLKAPKVLLLAATLGLAGLTATMGCAPASSSPGPVQTGAEMLVENEFETLAGKRVGLITNPTARVEDQHLIDVLGEKAREHKRTIMMGRTHGVHAEPTSFGMKMALFYAEMKRNMERFERAAEEIRVGKLSGAVGTFAHIPPEVERITCE